MIHSRVYGADNEGDWIVLLHGIGGSSSVWFKQVSLLRKYYKVLLLDLPSHGRSGGIEGDVWSISRCVSVLRNELKELGIVRYHLMGVSLGTILIHEWLKEDSSDILSVISVGTVVKFNVFGKLLIKLYKMVKFMVPVKMVYPLCAYVLLPKKNHKESRRIFIKESMKVKEREFRKWFSILDEVEGVYGKECMVEVKKYYITGEEDHMFIKGLKEEVIKDKHARIHIIEGSGHVCNVDEAEEFNYILEGIIKIESGEGVIPKEDVCRGIEESSKQCVLSVN